MINTRTKKKVKMKEPTLKEIQEWFAKHGASMTVYTENQYSQGGMVLAGTPYVSDNETVFVSKDGSEQMAVVVSYEEGCPTCGGAYVKRWRYMTERV
jgi:hypothetical protein